MMITGQYIEIKIDLALIGWYRNQVMMNDE